MFDRDGFLDFVEAAAEKVFFCVDLDFVADVCVDKAKVSDIRHTTTNKHEMMGNSNPFIFPPTVLSCD